MKTVRRIYRYLVTLISLEVILWGLIDLGRSAVGGEIVGGGASHLARSLSLILVGVPVFLLHWLVAQRDARQDEDERASRVRALFLYGALLATLIPVAQNTLTLVNHLWLRVLNLPAREALLSPSQTWPDNLIAIAINGLAAGYLFFVQRQNWQDLPERDAFVQTRRLYRYIWVVYGLVMLILGASQVLDYIFNLAETFGTGPQAALANGLSLVLVGAPLWAYTWLQVQRSLSQSGERCALLRLVLLYAICLISLGSILIPTGIILDTLLNVVLGQALGLVEIITAISRPLSVALSMVAVWLYYKRMLQIDLAILPESTQRDELRRAYQYILSALGLAATVFGLHMLFSYLIDVFLVDPLTGGGFLRERLAAALATLMVGAPLWGFVWFPLNQRVWQKDERADRARRSTVRKIFLYAALFAAVIGVMVSGGRLIYELLRTLLGDGSLDLLRTSLSLSKSLILFALLLGYHWYVLRVDLRLAERSLAERYAQFPVLILTKEIDDFSRMLVDTLHREAGSLPVAVHPIERGAPNSDLSAAKAVVLSSALIASPPEAIRLWLQDYSGDRVVVPTEVEGWHWACPGDGQLSKRAHRAAKIVRQLAEGEQVQQPDDWTAGKIVLYIFVGLLAIPLLLRLVELLLFLGVD